MAANEPAESQPLLPSAWDPEKNEPLYGASSDENSDEDSAIKLFKQGEGENIPFDTAGTHEVFEGSERGDVVGGNNVESEELVKDSSVRFSLPPDDDDTDTDDENHKIDLIYGKTGEESNNESHHELEASDAKKEDLMASGGGYGQLDVAESLYLSIDRLYHMSTLGYRWYFVRHFYLMFLPSIFITMLSAVGAFMIKSNLNIDEDVKSWIAFAVGAASIVNVFLQNLSNEVNYDHCNKSLRTLSIGLAYLLVDVKSYLKKCSEPAKTQEEYRVRMEKVAEMQKTFNTILKQNDAEIPSHIVIAYDLVESRLSLRLFPPVKFDKKDPLAKNKIVWFNMMNAVHNELFTKISEGSKTWLADIKTPDPEKMVRTAIYSVLEVLRSEQDYLLYESLLGSQQLIRNSNKSFIKRKQQDEYSLPQDPRRPSIGKRLTQMLGINRNRDRQSSPRQSSFFG